MFQRRSSIGHNWKHKSRLLIPVRYIKPLKGRPKGVEKDNLGSNNLIREEIAYQIEHIFPNQFTFLHLFPIDNMAIDHIMFTAGGVA